MRTMTTWLAAALVATAIIGCRGTVPIQNVGNASVANAANKPVSAADVRGAIVRAGAGLGWVMKDAGPGRLTGTLSLRTHIAEVDIPYSAANYSITNKGSTNLNQSGNMIHPNYNGWIQNLTKAINAQLSAI